MKIFLLKFSLVLSLMFIAVLYGMDLANDGINRMKGYEDEQFEETWSLNEQEDGEFEVSVLGNDMESHDLEKKKEQLEELKSYNFFAEVGKKLAETAKIASEKIIQYIIDLF